ncbi:Ubiquitin-like-specific protease ESD4 [Dichanthelium oligosanthes]|uniref:Ubiquitin-like-specific protease ESD4 n=1 Tax=Dichanthelium oligosanthes TaxID=888268 RepID=A0A1E5UN52_9POAL|nr:Ubiquitin-like-specific protease ESD4 [Dichanthelium oligosanthes]
MSSAVAHHCRKRRRDDVHGGASPTRCRRLLSPSPFPAVRPFSLRVALATSPRCRRKSRANDARHPVSTPRRRRRPFSRVLHFPGLRPFALRFLLASGASAPRCRRNPAPVNMGNCISQLLGKTTGDGGLEVHRERLEGSPEVVDLTLEPDLEPEKVDGVRRGIGDWSVPALESPSQLEKRATLQRERLEWAKRRDGRLQESGSEDLSELFTPLTDKDEREVDTLLYDSSHSDKIIVMHEPSNIEITKEKLECLRPRGWLNDEVINLYIELLKERAEREPKRFLKCHFFNTFFYKKLTCGTAGYDYQSVRRWTTFKKLGYGLIECEKIFVPVHRDIHWCLAVINMKDKSLQYLDSLGGLGHDVLRVLARYIMDELKDKSNIEIDTTWMVEVSDCLPLQHNGWDCGMFMLKYIDYHSRGLKPSFSQEHMMYFRKRTAKEIVRLRAD